ncbi:MAG TPA: PQQ-binding-like beta-propeller repeat protein [Bacteroidales bacterium]|nr:PQQ-binding-like beta-propeller repeat protein [Bacteroidales bacterium]
MKSQSLIFAMIFLSGFATVSAQDWPQYLGPNRNGVSSQQNIAREWSDKGPEVLWKVDLGIGFGGSVIREGKVYLLDREDKTGDKLRCLDLTTGKELWSFAYDAPGSVTYPGSRSVPAIDGNRIYTVGPYGQFYCTDINTHKPLWNKNIWTDFGGGQIPRWAITQCPLVYGDLVIVASQAPGAGVVAYNKLSGNVKWSTPSLGPVGYVSPSLLKVGNENHVVMITASAGRGQSANGGKVVGMDPSTGKVLWEYRNWQCGIPVPSAVDAGEGRALITGGYEAGAAMIKIERKTDGSYSVAELFKNQDFGAHTQPPVLVGGNFYAQYSTNERKDGLVCMSMDGKVNWKTGRSPLFDKGGMIYADGILLATDGAKKLYLVQPDAVSFKPLASADILNGDNASQNWAPLALSDGKLLIRDQNRLICIKVVK